MDNAGKYLIMIAVMFGLLYVMKIIRPPRDFPDINFKNSRTYFKEKSYDRGLNELILAIKKIKKLEKDLDLKSYQILEEAIMDLERVQRELKNDTLNIEHINISYSETLNALTEAEVKLSKVLLKTDHRYDAMMALKYSMMHLHNTLIFTEGEKKVTEKRIHDEINEILENKSLTNEQIEIRLNDIIVELDSLLEDNLHGGRLIK